MKPEFSSGSVALGLTKRLVDIFGSHFDKASNVGAKAHHLALEAGQNCILQPELLLTRQYIIIPTNRPMTE